MATIRAKNFDLGRARPDTGKAWGNREFVPILPGSAPIRRTDNDRVGGSPATEAKTDGAAARQVGLAEEKAR